jgi:type IV secretory pathway VirB10-like protein
VHVLTRFAEIASTLTHLKLSTTSPQKPAQKPKSKPVADSWDLEGSDTETEEAGISSKTSPHDSLDPLSTVPSNELSPHPPPPTPASPTPFDFPDNAPYGAVRGRGESRSGPDKRPEKTTAVAGRLIAGALGVRAPKRTDEEREFDKAMREKERKRRTEEKEREKRETEEAEARKKAIWDD